MKNKEPLQELVRKNISAARKARAMSQHALAAAAGITAAQISNIERGKSAPSLETLERLANVLDVRPDAFLTGNRLAPKRSAAAPAQRKRTPPPAYSENAMDRLVSRIAAGVTDADLAAAAQKPPKDADPAPPEYELAGIETIARGVCIRAGTLLACRAAGAKTCYLPGGHIEFGETGRAALVREMMEETGLRAVPGRFMGALENSFTQHGKPHAEINLIYEMTLPDAPQTVRSRENWIEFEWIPLDSLDSAGLLPEAFRALAGGTRFFEC